VIRRADSMSRTLSELAREVEGTVRGDPELCISGVNVLADAKPGELSFFNNLRYRDALKSTRASAVLVSSPSVPLVEGLAAIVVADPYLSFAKISAVFHPPPRFAPGIDPRAFVEAGAEVDPTATVMAFAYVGPGARVGARTVLFPLAFLGEGSCVGSDAVLYPHVTVREHCTVGDRAILQPGVVLGGDGFGFAFDRANARHFKIPQAGTVEVQDDVEIGSNSAVDRATLGRTVIGRGSKLDNLVQVGHNVRIGPLCILCGQVGLAGSSELGAGVVCGGQAGVGNHIKVIDGARVGAQSGVMDDIEEPGEYLGSPQVRAPDFMRAQAALQRGSKTLKDVRRLEKRVAELEAKLAKLAGNP
jgi:UDP-3-O-[3-hydroxymyristoyl] glucosamine N-acyltransferase